MSAAEDKIKELRKFQESLLSQGKREFWRSPIEAEVSAPEMTKWRSEEFVKRPQEAAESLDKPEWKMNRRRFMQWFAGASAVMGTTACSRRPQDYLVPYVRKPDALTYGVPVWYSSVAPSGLGVLVKTREGRPIKLEGNPDHPQSRGGLDARTQAEILNLYNPERLQSAVEISSGQVLSHEDIDRRMIEALEQAEPGSVRVLTGPISSPSLKAEIEAFSQKWRAKHIRMADISYEAMLRAYDLVAGSRRIPFIDFEKADVVVSIDADFLGTWLRPVEFTKSFSKRRKVHHGDLNVNQVFTFESQMTNTGVVSDFREPIKPSLQMAVILGIVNELSGKLRFDPAIEAQARDYSVDRLEQEAGLKAATIRNAAAALYRSRGRSVVVSSATGPQALELQLLTIALNDALGNFGSTLLWDQEIHQVTDSNMEFDELVQDMMAGRVQVLIINGVNPIYSRPASDFAAAVEKVPHVVTVAQELNETAVAGQFAVGESHFLEAWGDCQIIGDAVALQQPVIEPLFQTRSLADCLHAWARGGQGERERLMAFWSNQILGSTNFEQSFRNSLRAGVAVRNQSAPSRARFNGRYSGAVALIADAKVDLKARDYEISAYENIQMADGRYANNAWLQELPETVSKVTWDNYAGVSVNTARAWGVHEQKLGDFNMNVVELMVAGRKIELPVLVLPGVRDDVVAVALGYGRKRAGSIGSDVGSNAFEFAQNVRTGVTQLSGFKTEWKKINRRHLVATTQIAFDLHGRDQDVLQTTVLEAFKKDPTSAKDPFHAKFLEKNKSMYGNDFVYPGHKWGMSIDLNTCTGCQACVVACSSENNVPISGKDQVAEGRHMAWLRIDLYHKGEAQSPESYYEPMLCQQCDRAPCETVCPVLATVHTDDGLNAMSYNRCVGTRYCANNCPYKVRRFNWFQYSDKLAGKEAMAVTEESPLAMMLNPDVTVRTRGVMEKCTFCVQRIAKGVDEVKAEKGKDYNFRVPDGFIQTACQQSCPSDSIVFGDLNDENSEVSRRHKKVQQFRVLEILNTSPSTSYLPRVKNTTVGEEA